MPDFVENSSLNLIPVQQAMATAFTSANQL